MVQSSLARFVSSRVRNGSRCHRCAKRAKIRGGCTATGLNGWSRISWLVEKVSHSWVGQFLRGKQFIVHGWSPWVMHSAITARGAGGIVRIRRSVAPCWLGTCRDGSQTVQTKRESRTGSNSRGTGCFAFFLRRWVNDRRHPRNRSGDTLRVAQLLSHSSTRGRVREPLSASKRCSDTSTASQPNSYSGLLRAGRGSSSTTGGGTALPGKRTRFAPSPTTTLHYYYGSELFRDRSLRTHCVRTALTVSRP